MKLKYFYGSNTSQGFISYFENLYEKTPEMKMYILKGGPGTGKSSLMKKVAGMADNFYEDVILAPCSSDPDSLDAVIIPSQKICIADGTSPHILEPKFPGVVEEIINLGECWDGGKLKANGNEIIKLTKQNSAYHRKCMQFLAAAASVKKDNLRLAKKHLDAKKIRRFATRFASKNFDSPSGKIGKETRLFLSAVTPKGLVFFDETVENLCDRITVIKDDIGASAAAVLQELRCYALGCGHDIITSYCPVYPEILEHLIIPELHLAVVTSNSFHNIKFTNQKTVHSRRFISDACDIANRTAFNLKAEKELLDSAIEQMQKAKANHDELEGFYIQAMNFDLLNSRTSDLLSGIESLFDVGDDVLDILDTD